jgi:hypothetical protein
MFRRFVYPALLLTASLLTACGDADPGEEKEQALGNNGLVGAYFNNSDFTAPVLTRTDNVINSNWGSGAPASSMGADTFSVRWTGFVEPRYSELYTFYTQSDDGVRLWVNDQLLINNWTLHGSTENRGQITLTAGQRYAVKMEYYENGGSAVAQLRWSSPSQAKEIVPNAQLYTSATGSCANLPISGVTSTAVDGANVAANVLDNNFETRWSSFGKGAWIQADLGATQSVCSVGIAWHSGTQRKSNFEIAVSNDGSTYSTVFTGQSSGTSTAMETYAVTGSGRYVRVTVNGNTVNDWASITELRVSGGSTTPPVGDTTPPTAPTNLVASAASSSAINL